MGQGGEKLVRFAGILGERHIAGRGGAGAVMGSKNLKAIVIKATRKVKLPNPEEFKGLIKEQATSMRPHPMFPSQSTDGTLNTMEPMNVKGAFPTRNFREGIMDGWENISSAAFKKIEVKDAPCYNCMLRCNKFHKVTSGPYAGAANEGPEYESAWAFSGSIVSAEIGATVAADALCDDLGIDTISTGNAIGFVYELFERGILTLKDTDGLSLIWGNHAAAIEMIKRIGNREGLGDILAEGIKRASLHIGKGAEAYAIHIKGMELSGYECRALKRQGLGYATSPIGGSHSIGYCLQEIYDLPIPHAVDRFADEGGTDVVKFNQDGFATWETGIGCSFSQPMVFPDLFARMLVSVTGITEFGALNYLALVGERIFNLEQAFNVREGFNRKDDAFPLRITNEPLRNAGPSEGQIIRKPDALLDEYYQFRGWDRYGIPTHEKLAELGLAEIGKDIIKGVIDG
ncbi:aldehyde ferredoxin oxidoreductase family protein [Chloroflexota bacterium]